MIPIPGDWIARLCLAGALAAAAGTAWVWRYQAGLRDGRLERDVAVAKVQKAWDDDRLARSTAALDLIKRSIAERDEQQRRADDAMAAYRDLQARHDLFVAAAGRDVQRLRDAIAEFALGGSSGSAEADLATCRERAGALGSLLGEALRSSAECAADGESDRATARALWDAWPSPKGVAP